MLYQVNHDVIESNETLYDLYERLEAQFRVPIDLKKLFYQPHCDVDSLGKSKEKAAIYSEIVF